MFAFIEAEKADLPISFMCQRLGVSTSGFYEWRAAQANPCQRARENAELVETIREIHRASRQTYGSPRVTDELRLGLGRRVNHKRIERLMRTNGIVGLHRRRRNRGCTRRDPHASPAEDLVNRRFGVKRRGPAVVRRHHRAPDPRGQGVSLRGARRVEPPGRGLVDRR
jgi:putative transposase